MSSYQPVPGLSLRLRGIGAAMRAHAVLLFGLLAAMWAVEIIDLLPGVRLDHYGIIPRSFIGLRGLVCAPFLHVGFGHLIANSIPFVMLGGLVMVGGRALFWRVTLFVALVGGFGVWLVAPRNTVHIGASGVVFGYLGFVLARGYFEKSVGWMLTGLLILLLYGGILWGVLPLRAGVSWQSHLFGFLAGVAVARLSFRRALST